MTSQMLDTTDLGDALKALSASNRLRLFLNLREPRTLSELEMRPDRSDSTLRGDRTLSRQSISHHLSLLERAGLITSASARRNGRTVKVYQVRQAGLDRLNGLIEALQAMHQAPTYDGSHTDWHRPQAAQAAT